MDKLGIYSGKAINLNKIRKLDNSSLLEPGTQNLRRDLDTSLELVVVNKSIWNIIHIW